MSPDLLYLSWETWTIDIYLIIDPQSVLSSWRIYVTFDIQNLDIPKPTSTSSPHSQVLLEGVAATALSSMAEGRSS
jgi:hypothetical protein